MSFTIAARTILELGKELISSDEVALYELIKNAIDAQSPRVEIIVNVALLNSHYREAIAQVDEEERSRPEVIAFIQRSLVDSDNADSIALLDDLAEDRSKRIFLRRLKEFHEESNYIEVRDTGHGMSYEELSEVFLRIGTPSRRLQNATGASYLGDKGIGRLSAMRLGDRLQLRTSKSQNKYWNLIDIDWSRFSHDDDVDVDEIVIEPEIGDEKAKTSDHGTTIRVSALSADWDLPRFTDMLQGKISRMVDPFEPGLGNRLIVARHNGTRVQIPSIDKSLLRSAHAVCHAEFRMVDDTPTLRGEINYKYRQRKLEINANGPEIYSLAQKAIKRRAKRGHAAFKLVPIRHSALKRLGDFRLDLYWYNRKVVTAVEGLTNNVPDTRREISNWSGGPMLYRYGFRILPYGEPKDDWLALDQTAFGESGFKLNRQQVIGRVLLETSHSALREQTNREGLIESETSDALTKILLWIVHAEMRGLINEADDIERIERRQAEQQGTTTVLAAQARVQTALKRLRKKVGATADKQVDDLARSVGTLTTQSQGLIKQMEAVIEEADEEREKFVYLAGIGLMTEFIFHELERAVSYTLDLISRGAVQHATVESLREQLKTLHKRIAAFDELTGEKRQRRSTFDLSELVSNILENHSREFARHGINVLYDPPHRPYMIKAVRGMMIQILENLVVNAAYWLKQQIGFEADFRPTLTVSVDEADRQLTVEDNGPGVIEDRSERIFQPFITTKPTGQGRGLGLYIARDMAEYHGWRLYMDEEVGRIRKGRLNMFVLDME